MLISALSADVSIKDIQTNSKTYQKHLKIKNKVSFNEFKAITTKYSFEEVKEYQKQMARKYNVPLPVHEAIISVENGREYFYTINCNNNILPYTKDILQNYLRYVNCSNNVDIGYSQINYMIWKDRIDITQQDLLDPKSNIENSMKIVKMNYDGNWIRAIGHYHSYTPKFYNEYVKLAVVHLRRNLKERI